MKILILSTIIFSMLVVGCGGSDSKPVKSKPPVSSTSSVATVSSEATESSLSSAEVSSSQTSSPAPVLTGILLDAAVANIGYRTATQEGVTNVDGEFNYRIGELITFFIGGLELPAVIAKDIITPLDIANTASLEDNQVINILRLLQSLDADGDATNGIEITAAAIAAGAMLDFSLAPEEFAQLPAVQELLQAAGGVNQELVSIEQALAHFQTTLEFINGPSPSSSSQSSTIVVEASSSSVSSATVVESSSSAASSEVVVSSSSVSSEEVIVPSSSSVSSETTVESSSSTTNSEVAVSSSSASSEAITASSSSSKSSETTVESSSSVASSSAPANPTAWACPTTGLYFCDDFSANNHDNWDLKAEAENSAGPNGTFGIVDDSDNYILGYTAASTGGVIALIKPEAFTGVTSADYYVEAKIRPRENSTTGNKQIYLVTRYVDDSNWYAGALNVQNATTSTQVEIAKMKAGSLSRPKQVKKPIEQGKAGELDGQWYTLRIEALGNNLTVYLDGETIATQTDSDFAEAGLIGLWTANKSFEIDDIKVGNANEKPASLLLSAGYTSYAAEVGDAARTINVMAKTDSGADDTFTVEADQEVVSAVVNGNEVTVTPVGEGSTTIIFTSGSGLVRMVTATIAPQFVMPTATYNFTNQLSPVAGETNAYEDATLKLIFDSAPTLGTAGSVRIFKTSDDSLVDKIALVDESDAIGFGTLRSLKTKPIRISGNTASISLHANKLEPGTSYYVAISESMFSGANLAGQTFTGLGKNANWNFTTRPALAAGLTNLLVDDNGTTAHFRSVQGALNYAMKNIALDDAATITINNGIYEEPLYLRSKNNVTLIGESRDGTVIQYFNNDALNSGSAGRALFLVEAADMLTLENLTIKNTTLSGSTGGQAEAIYFNSPTGRLIARHANFISEQDTLLLKGWTWFYDTLVAGTVDFIWGYSKASLFEKSEIRSLGRSSGNNNGGYILQARVEAEGDKGFVFLNSSLTSGAGPTGELPITGSHYLARSPGPNNPTFDNIVFVNTKMGAHINAIGWAGLGINSQPKANPETGTAISGWREYNTMDLNGAPLSLASRQFGYELSLAEAAGYCSRAQVFAAYNSGAGWNPLPDDNSDCVNVDGSVTNSSFSSSSASSENDSSASATTSSGASSSVSSEIVGGGSSSDATSSSSSAAPITTTWTPTYSGLQAVVVAQPVAGNNANFNATSSPITVDGIKFYSASAGSLRLHLANDGTTYAVNYNGTSAKNDTTDTPVTFVEGSSQVNPTELNLAGGVTRFVSVPFTPVATPVTLTVNYSNGSATAAGACQNGQIAIVDQTGKTWKVASSCSNPERSTITATITDSTVSELFILMSRNGDGSGGIRIWDIEITK